MKSKIIKVVLLILILALIGFISINFNKSTVQAATSTGNVATSSKLVSGQPNPDTYNYHINTGNFEADTHGPTWLPLYKDFQIYCIETHAIFWFDQWIWYSEALRVNGMEYTLDCRLGGRHAVAPYEVNEHYEEGYMTYPQVTPVSTSTLPPAMAYIVSDSPDEWTLEKQRGLWNLRDEVVYNAQTGKYVPADNDIITGTQESTSAGPSKYDTVALNYAEFDYAVRGSNGMNIKDTTDMDEFTIVLDRSTNEYVMGPISMSYINGTYGNNTFGGITGMSIVGYNADGELVRDDITINGLRLRNSSGTYGNSMFLDFFKPNSTSKIDTTSQSYPKSGQEFQLVFDNPNTSSTSAKNKITTFKLRVKFRYMLANGRYSKLRSIKYYVKYHHNDKYNPHTHNGVLCYGCKKTTYLEELPQQWTMAADGIRSLYEQQIELGNGEIDTTINIGGHVWEDAVTGKESIADGLSSTSGDKSLKNIKVTLYTQDGSLAQLDSDPNEAGISESELMSRINPTYTDANGNYLFKGVDSSKKYYVVFEYNGQKYMPTEYLKTSSRQYTSASQMVNAGLYNSTLWNTTSKATEANTSTVTGVKITRTQFDNRFREIASYPENYTSSNSLNRVGTRNATYTQLELMGYTLDENGNYRKTGTQLVDGYLYNTIGLETNTYSEGEISKRVRDYIKQNKKFPDTNAMKTIYSRIAGNDTELWRKLQFIEDTYIQAYSGSPSTQRIDLYPVLDNFVVNDDGSTVSNGLYPGQLYVNLGLWRRQEYDASLRKDAYKSAVKINDKTVVYNYNKRAAEQNGANNSNGQDNNTYWDINVRMSDYNSYYGLSYNREIYNSDYTYNSSSLNRSGSNLEVYVTYKITIRNQSMSIMTQIEEIVDYYDADYTFKPNLSWAMYQTSSNRNTSVDDDAYYRMMNQSQSVIDRENTNATTFITNGHAVEAYEGDSKYNNEKNLGSGYKNLYIRGLDDKTLATGETAYVYLTFEVNKDSSGRIILDDTNSSKQNLAEINGYTTFYRDGTRLPNGVTKNSSNYAGLIDRDSNPGNLTSSDLSGNRFERNFEDDTDRAPNLRVLLDNDAVRRINGTVWEDERTETVGNASSSQDAIIGDGIRQNEEDGISGVTVQLVEKCSDGSEYIWMETTTDGNGKYSFEGFVPGDYVIRFYYGDTAATAIPSSEQPVSYNGQDFKSTTYQDGITQSGNTDISGEYRAYTNTATQNESGTYGYDIYKADSNSTNYSDAKDIWSTSNRAGLEINGPVNSARQVQGRQDVMNYSTGDMTNHKAEVLASPYETPTYNGTAYTDEEMNALRQELMNETYMTAETGVIVAEIEYDRQQTDGLKSTLNNSSNSTKNYIGANQYNSNYTLNNVDLGLTERPKAQLEIDKSIANIKVTLANNSILFDINEAANNAIWQDHQEYSIDENKIDNSDRGIDFESGEIGMYQEYYGNNNRHRYSYREQIDAIVTRADKGLVQLTMDEELMHGATIQITYTIKVTNVGEVDYVDGNSKNFYYKGNTSGAHVGTTTAVQVVDYVQNNLQFAANNETNSNSGWQIITATDLTDGGLVNNRLAENLTEFNNIIQTESFNTNPLLPGEEDSKTLIVSQLITPENTDDDMTYNNMVELVKTSNEVGRRMAYSVVGNQNPLLDDASEVDSSAAERIVILPPFGEVRIYYAIGAAVAVILIAGIILIRRKVLKNKKQ